MRQWPFDLPTQAGRQDIDDLAAHERVEPRALPGSILRILELPPNTPALMHRTDTIDYVLMMEGECDMLLDDGKVVYASHESGRWRLHIMPTGRTIFGSSSGRIASRPSAW